MGQLLPLPVFTTPIILPHDFNPFKKLKPQTLYNPPQGVKSIAHMWSYSRGESLVVNDTGCCLAALGVHQGLGFRDHW